VVGDRLYKILVLAVHHNSLVRDQGAYETYHELMRITTVRLWGIAWMQKNKTCWYVLLNLWVINSNNRWSSEVYYFFLLAESSLNYSRNPDVRNAMDMVRKSVTTGSLNSRGTRKSLMINAATRISVAKGISLKAHSKYAKVVN